ncbi:DUF1273 domain-containing protein (plasmid) [Phormidium yuhuli AB48]|uniref:DUF1273 domain-containing protein n=1 Tax=Phormidium yuhuli AB48 TaxID=2940671 RepID=A0ABY5AWK7_9CYAN|nr:SLOG family protein [Phormidium yuhuli]USR93271.1 DUF1273 domain-containing protein [Phormidium yuhuli AB48]
MRKVIAITGHRRFSNLRKKEVQAWIQSMSEMALRLHSDAIFICGGAPGVDLWAAEVWSEMGVDWVLVKPCGNHGEGVWSPQLLARRDELAKKAMKVKVLMPEYRRGCLNKRNEFMVNHSDLVLGLFDGRQRGGTKHCLSYARQNEKPIVWLDCRQKPILRSVNLSK